MSDNYKADGGKEAMSPDFWWALHLRPRAADREEVNRRLFAAGCLGVWEVADGDEIIAYFPSTHYDRLCRLGEEVASWLTAPVRLTRQAREDWLEGWKKNFRPLSLTPAWTVVPSWWPAAKNPERRIIIHPGLAFGTGSHETTRLAAVLLEKLLLPGYTVLDVGTGSGILAILAHKLGAGQITAVDIDEEALANARENCRLNGCAAAVACSSQPLAALGGEYDLVVANIIAPVLLELAPELVRKLRPGGVLILSGILAEQLSRVRRAYEKLGLRAGRPLIDGEWGAFHVVHQDRPPPVL